MEEPELAEEDQYNEDLYDRLEEILDPLVTFVNNVDNPLHREVCALYSIQVLSRLFSITESLGILERVKFLHMEANSNPKDIEETVRLSFIS